MNTIIIKDPSATYLKSMDLSDGQTAALSLIIPINVNDDGLTDFIVHYWRNPNQNDFGQPFLEAEPTQDALVALISQPNGNYVVDNQRVFGADVAQLGAASASDYSQGDINNDGIDDYAFSLTYDDGRVTTDQTTPPLIPTVILSDREGKYDVVGLESSYWVAAVDLVDNGLGYKDIAFSGNYFGFDAFRFFGDEFVGITDEYPNQQLTKEWFEGLKFFESRSDEPASFVIAGLGTEVGLYSKTSIGWNLVSTWSASPVMTLNYIGWTNNLYTTEVVEVDGTQYTGGKIVDIEIFTDAFSGKDLIIARMEAFHTPGVEIYDPSITYDQDDQIPVNFLLFFDRNGDKLVLLESPILDEEISANYTRYDYKDINNDGLNDIITYAFSSPHIDQRVSEGGKPIVYLQRDDGYFIQADLSALPAHSSSSDFGPELQGFMTDVNTDGIQDLILVGTTGDTFGQGNGDFEIHLLDQGSITLDRLIVDRATFAFDSEGSAGQTVKTIAAILGSEAISDSSIVGVGLTLFDAGMTIDQVCGLGLDYVGATTNEQVVNLLYFNLFGYHPDSNQAQPYIDLIVNGTFTQETLAAAAAELTDDFGLVDLVVLSQTGVEYSYA